MIEKKYFIVRQSPQKRVCCPLFSPSWVYFHKVIKDLLNQMDNFFCNFCALGKGEAIEISLLVSRPPELWDIPNGVYFILWCEGLHI